jgi:hypothetical protein
MQGIAAYIEKAIRIVAKLSEQIRENESTFPARRVTMTTAPVTILRSLFDFAFTAGSCVGKGSPI